MPTPKPLAGGAYAGRAQFRGEDIDRSPVAGTLSFLHTQLVAACLRQRLEVERIEILFRLTCARMGACLAGAVVLAGLCDAEALDLCFVGMRGTQPGPQGSGHRCGDKNAALF